MFCECGCGQRTRIITIGSRRGQHLRYIHGHNGKRPVVDTAEKAWDMLVRPKLVERPSGCWEFTGSKTKYGYGQVWLTGPSRRLTRTHRIAFEAHSGQPIPAGACVLHSCDNGACCNPAHLRLGTQTENTRDMVLRNRHRRGERHPDARFTEGQVRDIRARYDAGESLSAIARSYHAPLPTVANIAYRYNWKHVA